MRSRRPVLKAVSEFFFRANVGNKISERQHTEVRFYEAKPGGRLLSFTIEDKGDGGNQRLEGKAKPDGIRVVRTRPGQAAETLTLSVPRAATPRDRRPRHKGRRRAERRTSRRRCPLR